MSAPTSCASPTTRRMIVGSPPWNPVAIFAVGTSGKMPASSPSVQRPNPSPMSQLMLIWVTMVFGLPVSHRVDRRLTEQCFSCHPDFFSLGNADGSEIDDIAGLALANDTDIAADYRCDLGVATEARHVGTHDDWFQTARHLDTSQGSAVVNNVGGIRTGLF